MRVTLASARLDFTSAPNGSCPVEVFHLYRGLKLRHRGIGEPVKPYAREPLQLVKIELTGLRLQDVGREAISTMFQTLSGAMHPAPPEAPSVNSESACAIGYNLEAMDVCLEANMGSEPWRCWLPCIRLRSTLGEMDDIWSYTLWGPAVTRESAAPFGASVVEPAARSWWEPAAQQPPLDLVPRRSGHTASDVIADLERELSEERRAREAERQRAQKLAAELGDVLRVVQSSSGGSMPAALQSLMTGTGRREGCIEESAEGPSGGASDADALDSASTSSSFDVILGGKSFEPGLVSARMSPGMTTVSYELAVGEEVRHHVTDLQRGDAVVWSIEELQELTVDITVILRSRCKVHAARLLQETERLSRCRSSFMVTEDFGKDLLPLTLELHLSNGFSWWAAKSVQLQLCEVRCSGAAPGLRRSAS